MALCGRPLTAVPRVRRRFRRLWTVCLAASFLLSAAPQNPAGQTAAGQTAPGSTPPVNSAVPPADPTAKPAAPQQEITQHDEAATFRTHVNLVMVPVVVRDKTGKAVGTLTKNDFQLFDKTFGNTADHIIEQGAAEAVEGLGLRVAPGAGDNDFAVVDLGTGVARQLPIELAFGPFDRDLLAFDFHLHLGWDRNGLFADAAHKSVMRVV